MPKPTITRGKKSSVKMESKEFKNIFQDRMKETDNTPINEDPKKVFSFIQERFNVCWNKENKYEKFKQNAKDKFVNTTLQRQYKSKGTTWRLLQLLYHNERTSINDAILVEEELDRIYQSNKKLKEDGKKLKEDLKKIKKSADENYLLEEIKRLEKKIHKMRKYEYIYDKGLYASCDGLVDFSKLCQEADKEYGESDSEEEEDIFARKPTKMQDWNWNSCF